MDQLFDTTPYETPVEETVQYMGEHPPLTAQDWLTIADQLHAAGDDAGVEHALAKHERARRVEGTTLFLGGTALLDN